MPRWLFVAFVVIKNSYQKSREGRNSMLVLAIDKPDVAPFEMPARFRTDVAYFMTPAGERGAPKLPAGEYWISLDDARRWLDDGVVEVVSPLDSVHATEFELTEEQENWLRWLVEYGVQHVRIE
jgi:hypothetical protein